MEHIFTILAPGVKTIACVSLARSDDESRYQLMGVYLDFPKFRAVATCGKTLAVGALSEAVDVNPGEKEVWQSTKPFLLSPEACKAIVKTCSWKQDRYGHATLEFKRSVPTVRLHIQKNACSVRYVVVDTVDKQETFAEMDGVYPQYDTAFPNVDKCKVRDQKLNPELLARAKKILVRDFPPDAREFITDGPGKPAWLADTTVAYAVMPLVGQTLQNLKDHEADQRGRLTAIFATK